MTLPAPYWQSDCDRYRIFLGDCLEILPELWVGSVDAVVTDPPYGIGFRGEEWDNEIPDWLPLARQATDAVAFTTAPNTMWDYPRPRLVACWYRPASCARAPGGGFNHWSPVLVYGESKFSVDCINLHAIQHAQPRGFPHPCPKPLALMAWVIEAMSDPYDTILDPFTGSGTTGVACVKTGRRFVGIEIEEKYCEIAAKRIEDEANHLFKDVL